MNVLKTNDKIANGIIRAKRKAGRDTSEVHRHEFFEIEYIIKGRGEYEINGVSYSVEDNMIFLMIPCDFHSVNLTDCELISINFPCEYADFDCLYNIMSSGTRCIKLENDFDQTVAKTLLCEIVNYFEAREYKNALKFLSCLLTKMTSLFKEDMAYTPSYVQKAVLYLLENFRNGVTLDSAAAYVGVSSAYLSDVFHKYMGVTFKNYLNNLQYDYAVRLLNFSDLNVQEICYESGFNDYANFTRRFKSRYNMTPRKYREKKRSKE